MWKGKQKAITFSFDDGVEQDIRVIEIMERYGLKGTFNLNSGNMGISSPYTFEGRRIERTLLPAHRVKEIYKNQEVASHTMSHFNLTTLDDDTVIRQVDLDVGLLSDLVGYPVTAMAYPCGGVNNDDRVADLIKSHTPIGFARTTTTTKNFDIPENLYRYNPTVYFRDVEDMFALAERFLKLKTEKPQVFYIWGHTYELDEASDVTWEIFEKFCRFISRREDIFYGTNSQIFLKQGE